MLPHLNAPADPAPLARWTGQGKDDFRSSRSVASASAVPPGFDSGGMEFLGDLTSKLLAAVTRLEEAAERVAQQTSRSSSPAAAPRPFRGRVDG